MRDVLEQADVIDRLLEVAALRAHHAVDALAGIAMDALHARSTRDSSAWSLKSMRRESAHAGV